jgi:hypothetical protein
VALSPAASFPASPLSLWPSRGRTKHERWREERLSPDVIFPAKNLEQSFRDVLLATRVPSPVAEVAAVETVVTASADPLAPRGSTNAARPAPHCFSKESEEELITDGMVVTAPADPPAPCGPLFATSRRVAAMVGTTLFVSADASAPRRQPPPTVRMPWLSLMMAGRRWSLGSLGVGVSRKSVRADWCQQTSPASVLTVSQ